MKRNISEHPIRTIKKLSGGSLSVDVAIHSETFTVVGTGSATLVSSTEAVTYMLGDRNWFLGGSRRVLSVKTPEVPEVTNKQLPIAPGTRARIKGNTLSLSVPVKPAIQRFDFPDNSDEIK